MQLKIFGIKAREKISPMEDKAKVHIQIQKKYTNTWYCANIRKEHKQTQKQKQLIGRIFQIQNTSNQKVNSTNTSET